MVVPCFNEERALWPLYRRLAEALSGVADEFEVLFVDDGSTDRTLAILREIAADDPRFRYVALSRNFGKESAMLAGLNQAKGDAIAIMDADLQHPPELLGEMVALLAQGHQQVVARRTTRAGESRIRTLGARLFYRIVNRLSDVDVPEGLGDFRLLGRDAVDALLRMGEYNRFSKGLFSWIGFDMAVVEYENVRRHDGASSWTFRKLLDYGIDGVVSFNSKPLRLAIYVGALCTLLAFGYAGWVLISALVQGNSVPGYVTLLCGVVGFGGLQLLVLGVIGEYLGRIYFETKRRPHFLIKEASGAGPRTVPLDGNQRPGVSRVIR